MQYIKNIDSIQFGVMSKEEIRSLSVAEISSTKITPTGVLNSVYDYRMGPMNYGEECPTCHMETSDCPGHFGHIELSTDVIHPLYSKFVLSFLRCFCNHCSRLLVTKEHLELWGFMKYKNETRFKNILEKFAKLRFCLYCNTFQPHYTYSTVDTIFFAHYKTNEFSEKMKVSVLEIRKIFQNVIDEDLVLLGFNPSTSRPINLILSVLPVIPPRSRPYIVTENLISDDDLTIQLNEIIKANNSLKAENISEAKREKYTQTLNFRIRTLMDNSNGRAKHTNSRPIKGIKERLTSKDGLIRSNLMGKRVNSSARSVIGPDPTLDVDEIDVPHEIADVLTYPERVSDHNLNYLQDLVWNDKANHVIRGKRKYILKYALAGEKRYEFRLQIGDIVERKLQNGDYVVLNRQPTLHKTSMLAMKARRCEGKTIRMNLGITSTFNADFDGDEMNLHMSSSEMSRTELELLSTPAENFVGIQSSKPTISIVQDALLGSYLMTKTNDPIDREDFYQICMKLKNFDFEWFDTKLKRIEQVYKTMSKDIPLYSGKSLFSLLLPDDFIYHEKNGALIDEPIVRIHMGVLYEGAINKANLKGNHCSIHRILHKEYSTEIAMKFCDNVQFIANDYLLLVGFSVGISDCIATKKSEIKHAMAKCFAEAEGIEETVRHPLIREAKIVMSLSKAKDIGMRIAKDAFNDDNRFLDTVTSGSKGDFFNICQITGLLGQQSVAGKRIHPYLNRGRRTLPHYHIDEKETKVLNKSKGFITHSFFRGLTPQEFWFHAMSGRDGILGTALKTAQSGYTQRKMVKITEDVQIKYDQSVRNSVGNIIQFAYGGNNFDPTETISTKNGQDFCNISRLADRLNLRYENENE